jgi:preprotein translocase subunit SecD
MKTLKELLQDADPVRHEPNQPLLQERARRRDAVLSGASRATTPSTQPLRSRTPLLAAAAMLALIVTAVVGSHLRAPGTVDLQAAVRFEVRLAEDSPAPGLQAVRVDTNRAIYLHPDAIVTNSDIAQARVVPGNSASRFGVGIEFNAAGAQKMRTATAGHLGKPLAILIDSKVVMAPTVRSAIDALAEINGDLTRAEAERIVTGIGIQ